MNFLINPQKNLVLAKSKNFEKEKRKITDYKECEKYGRNYFIKKYTKRGNKYKKYSYNNMIITNLMYVKNCRIVANFKDMILQETTSLKKSLNEGGLIVNSFFLSNKNSQNAYEQLKEVDLGYNVKA